MKFGLWKVCLFVFYLSSTLTSKKLKNNKRKAIPKILIKTVAKPLQDQAIPIKNEMISFAKNEPEWIQLYFCDEEVKAFITLYMPAYLDDYNNIIPGAHRADIFRLMVVYLLGGIYIDIGYQFLQPLSTWMAPNTHYITVTDRSNDVIGNAFFGTYPRNRLIKQMLQLGLFNIGHRLYGCGHPDIAGPKALGRIFKPYLGLTLHDPIPVGLHTINNEQYQIIVAIKKGYYVTCTLDENDSNKRNYLMKTKFEKYRDLVYGSHSNDLTGNSSQLKHYTVYWAHYMEYIQQPSAANGSNGSWHLYDGQIFDLHPPPLAAIKNYVIPYSDKGSYVIVHDGQVYAFPNTAVFKAMDMTYCSILPPPADLAKQLLPSGSGSGSGKQPGKMQLKMLSSDVQANNQLLIYDRIEAALKQALKMNNAAVHSLQQMVSSQVHWVKIKQRIREINSYNASYSNSSGSSNSGQFPPQGALIVNYTMFAQLIKEYSGGGRGREGGGKKKQQLQLHSKSSYKQKQSE